MGIIYFNGIPSTDVGLVVEHYPNYQYAEKEYESITVPGRNGTIYRWNGNYKNVSQPYDLAFGAQVGDDGRFFQMADDVVDWLHPFSREQSVEDAGKPYSGDDYFKLSDSYNPDVYRLAVYKEAGNIKNLLNSAGRITVKFDCKPQRFLVLGDVPIVAPWRNTTMSMQVINNTNYTAKPIIILSEVSGHDFSRCPIVFTINGERYTFNNLPESGNLTINCEDEEIYNDGQFYNSYMESSNLTFPSFPPQSAVTVSWENAPGDYDVTDVNPNATVTIIPKWWTI